VRFILEKDYFANAIAAILLITGFRCDYQMIMNNKCCKLVQISWNNESRQ